LVIATTARAPKPPDHHPHSLPPLKTPSIAAEMEKKMATTSVGGTLTGDGDMGGRDGDNVV